MSLKRVKPECAHMYVLCVTISTLLPTALEGGSKGSNKSEVESHRQIKSVFHHSDPSVSAKSAGSTPQFSVQCNVVSCGGKE